MKPALNWARVIAVPVPAVHGSGVRPADGSVTSAHLSCFLSVPVSRLLSCSHLHFRERSFRTFGSVGFVSGVIILCATAALTTAVRARVNAGVDTPGESPGYSLAGGLKLTQPIHRRRLYFRVPYPRGYMLLRLTALDFLLLFTREGWYVLSLFFLFSMSPLSFCSASAAKTGIWSRGRARGMTLASLSRRGSSRG